MLAPEVKEQIVGLAEVREVFRSSKFGTVAGCIVADGYVRRNNPIRVLRDNVVIFEGGLESLRRFKDDVNEVRAGTECGIGVKNYNDVQRRRPDRVLLARRSGARRWPESVTDSDGNKAYPRAKRVGAADPARAERADPARAARSAPRHGHADRSAHVERSELREGLLLGARRAIRSWRRRSSTQAARLLRGPLGRALGIRHSPELRFVQDELIENGARLSALINKAVKDDVARHVDDPPGRRRDDDA